MTPRPSNIFPQYSYRWLILPQNIRYIWVDRGGTKNVDYPVFESYFFGTSMAGPDPHTTYNFGSSHNSFVTKDFHYLGTRPWTNDLRLHIQKFQRTISLNMGEMKEIFLPIRAMWRDHFFWAFGELEFEQYVKGVGFRVSPKSRKNPGVFDHLADPPH